eukprot:1702131-Lingulodinium_polyedra.AAC.1
MGIHVWGITNTGEKKELPIIILSRVTERTSIYACYIMRHVLKTLQEQWNIEANFNSMEVWSDGAPQFKSRRTLAEVGWR